MFYIFADTYQQSSEYMRRVIIIAVLLFAIQAVWADNAQLLVHLDSALAHKPAKEREKQRRINFLKRNISDENGSMVNLKIYNAIYREYYVFNSDSASLYVNKGMALAKASHNTYFLQLNTIHKAELLAMSGLYSESISTIERIGEIHVLPSLKFDYYFTLFRIYWYWSVYCNDREYSPLYGTKGNDFLKKAYPYFPKDGARFYYYMGEYYLYIHNDRLRANRCYQLALRKNAKNSRIYAMSCYALSNYYLQTDNEASYEEYLIRGSISDAESVTMEASALQSLAFYLCRKDKDYLERSQFYIRQSLSDAKFYNNRLRIIEISKNLPTIIQQYQDYIESRNHRLMAAFVITSLLLIVLTGVIFLFFRLNKRLAFSRRVLKLTNVQLADLYKSQEDLNRKLHSANLKLLDTNRRRENLAKLFIDLCDKYITRLGKYQMLVVRKIKANQVNELLSHMSSTRLSDENAEIFYTKFDNAFLSLYPDFVDELNGLLQKDQQIHLKKKGSLNTELRIFALIRLGVKESNEISNLLFYSHQTIYNYRSDMKSRAIDKDNFEENVRKLCIVNPKE